MVPGVLQEPLIILLEISGEMQVPCQKREILHDPAPPLKRLFGFRNENS